MKKTDIVLFLLLAIPSGMIAQQSKITGKVVEAGLSQPLPGVHLMLYALSGEGEALSGQAVTGPDGIFEFPVVPYGDYRLRASHLGYEIKVLAFAAGDPAMDLVLRMAPESRNIEEIIVSSLRKDKPLKESAMPFAVLRSADIEGLGRPTLAEILSIQPGLNMVRDGIWATSINLRGLGEDRLITMINGNRLETATDLSAALSLIDPADIEQVEVIKSGASALYGSGSLGGVVNIITSRADYADQWYLKGQAGTGYHTVNNLTGTRLQLLTGSRRWHLQISGNLRKADDSMTPEGVLPNSQFNDRSMTADAGVKLSDHLELNASYQHIYAWDVGIPGGKVLPATATATYTRALRDLISVRLNGTTGGALEAWSVRYFYQDILRDVEVIPNTPPAVTPLQITTPLYFTPAGLHRTQGISLQTDWRPLGKHSIVAGIDLWSRHLTTGRNKYIQVELLDSLGEVYRVNNITRGEVPIPEAWFSSTGIFVHDEISLADSRLKLQLGGRMDGIYVRSGEAVDPLFLTVNGNRNDNPPNQRITFPEADEQDLSWSLNAGLVYHVTPASDLTLALARSHRSASLEERFKYIDLGSLVRIGDPSLSPEQGWSADLGWRTWNNRYRVQFNVFANRVNGLITEIPGTYVYTLSTGPLTGTTDTLPALINANVDKALLTGFDLGGEFIPAGNWFAGGSAGFVLGYNLESESPLPLIPPLNGELHAGYRFSGIGQVRLQTVLFADQNRTLEGERETPGFALYHFYFQTVAIPVGPAGMQFFAGVENLTDRAYRHHLASNRGNIDIEPGRNIFLKLSVRW